MIRHIATVAVATLFLSPSWLCAQTTSLTVTAASADVHKFASIGSPVIAKVARGTVLDVTRELGSWVTVSWPAAEGGAGHMHVSTGSIAARSTPGADGRAAGTLRPAAERSPAANAGVENPQGSPMPVPVRLAPAPSLSVPVGPATHIVGLGGQMAGSTAGLGITARTWKKRIGVQFVISRSALTSLVAPGRLTSTQVEPSLLFVLPDRVGDYMWVRPYVGSGASLRRQTLNSAIPGAVDLAARTGLGVQAFGGAEFTFSGLPRFALSADLGYRWSRMPVAGFDVGGPGVTVSGHWYVK